MTWLALFAAAKAELGSDKFASQLTMGVKRKLQIYAHGQSILCPSSFYIYSIGLEKFIVYFENTSALSQHPTKNIKLVKH